jgi:hypothetical protein
MEICVNGFLSCKRSSLNLAKFSCLWVTFLRDSSTEPT